MTIIKTLDKYDFRNAFLETRPNNFSLSALDVLYDYFEEYSDSTGEPWELDVIAVCCDFSEMSWSDIASDYRVDLSECETDEERIETVEEYLSDNTSMVTRVEGDTGPSFVFRVF